METKNISRIVYQLAQLLFWGGLAVTIIGLSMAQSWCSEHELESANIFGALLSPLQGDNCDRKFRFPWFVLALNMLAAVLAIAATFLPDIISGASTALFATILPLDILLTNTFYNIVDTDDMEDSMYDRARVTLAGFAIMAAGALLMLIMDSALKAAARDKNSSRNDGDVGGKATIVHNTMTPVEHHVTTTPVHGDRYIARPLPAGSSNNV